MANEARVYRYSVTAWMIPVLLGLAQPTNVLEEWEIVSRTPLREGVTARGVYTRSDGADALLPVAVQGRETPTVFVVGGLDLPAHRAADGWHVTLPDGDRSTVRVVARVERRVGAARLFHLAWPQVPTARVPTRRIAEIDRTWLIDAPSDWSCADDGGSTVSCATTAPRPTPLASRVPPPPSTRGGWATTCAALLLALGALLRLRANAKHPREHAIGVFAGLGVGAVLALAVAGTALVPWSMAVALACVPAMAFGALAARTRASRGLGALALLGLPLLVVVSGRWDVMAMSTGAVALALVATALWRGTPPIPPASVPMPAVREDPR